MAVFGGAERPYSGKVQTRFIGQICFVLEHPGIGVVPGPWLGGRVFKNS